jgi:hypothetical protein
MERRVKLTKDYFRGEGWLVYDEINYRGSYEPYWEIQAMGALCELFYRSDINLLQITRKAGHMTIYHGKCNNVLDFKLICSLVNAKPYYKHKESIPK